MNYRASKIKNNVQDRKSVAWKRLCEYVDKVALENREEFAPLEELGPTLFKKIHTLPESISKLKKVKKVFLYGSKLKRLPPEIGEMEALEYFDTYTSHDLHWFPYEITRCKNLTASRVSYRALYGNMKTWIAFPRLMHNPVRYFGETVKCSICGAEMNYYETNQLWTSLKVGTFVLPLLANLCSKDCENALPPSPEGYPYHGRLAHKGSAPRKELRAHGLLIFSNIKFLLSCCAAIGLIPLTAICIYVLIIHSLPTLIVRMAVYIGYCYYVIFEVAAVISVVGFLFKRKS
jgi:hypothetical protein